MDKLKALLARCKCGVFLTVNEHRDCYESVSDHLENSPEEIPGDVLAKMIEMDTIIDLQFYPDTPIGFYRILHHDLDAALDAALDCLQSNLTPTAAAQTGDGYAG